MYAPYGPGCWWGFGWIFLLFALFLVFRFLAFRRFGGPCRGPGDAHLEPEEILKRRLASGVIAIEEYERLLPLIQKQE